MTTLPTSVVIHSIVELLTEAYEGPPDPTTTWFIDNEPDSGILGILKGVTVVEATQSVDGSGDSGTTIVSHAEHLRWSLAMINAAMQGQPFEGKWAESWQVNQADQAGWDRLRAALRAEFESLRQTLQSQTELPEQYLSGVFALMPHAAYHLGTIRQMIERVRGAK